MRKKILLMETAKIMEALSTVKDPQTGKDLVSSNRIHDLKIVGQQINLSIQLPTCLLYTSPSPRDRTRSRMPSSA